MNLFCNGNNKNRGFTLIEMLIVVAIIAILVSVAVPVFRTQMEKSRESTDIANMRSARSVMTAAYLSGELEQGIDKIFYFDGGLTQTRPADLSYGRGTGVNTGSDYLSNASCAGCAYDSSQNYSNSYLICYADIDGRLHVHWASNNLNFEPASSKLPSAWKSWTRTDSAGAGGATQRKQVLEEMGLSDNHEYAIVYNTGKPVDIYIYDGKFPTSSLKLSDLTAAFDEKGYQDVNVTHYTYDESTRTTTLIGIESMRAGIKKQNNGSSYFVQMKSIAEWENDSNRIF